MKPTSASINIDNIIIDEKANDEIIKIIGENLKAYNESKIGTYHRDHFTIYIKSNAGKIIGGLSGNILGNLCVITLIWVDEKYRGQGIGHKMLAKLEIYAKSKHCLLIQLDTAEFQAKDFYEKAGYNVAAKLDNGFMGYDQYIMRKYLT